MSKLATNPVWRGIAFRKSVLGMAVATALALPQMAAAMDFDLGSDTLSFRWDNTVRLNVANRVSGRNNDMAANPNYDDGDRNFNSGSIWTRFDLYSEADLVWKPSWGTLGARVSAQGWWDPGYRSLDNTSVQTANNLKNGVPTLDLSGTAKRYNEGPSGEFMDWFLFGSFTVGEAPVNVKIGQTTVYYGESLFAFAHGISYSQNPVDIVKALSTPGAEAKELYRPRVGFNVNSQVTDTLNVALQYFFNWQDFQNQSYRYPENGSFLTLSDPTLWGSKSLIYTANPLYGYPSAGGPLGPVCNYAPIPGSPTCSPQQWLRFWRGKDITPDENSGNYGLAVRWAPEWANATLGLYYRRTYDMQPQLMVTPDLIPGLPNSTACRGLLNGLYLGGNCLQNSVVAYLPTPPYPANTPAALNQTGIDFLNNGRIGTYNLAYGKDIDIIGLSLSKNIGGLSLGAELSYRKDMPLLSDPVQVLPAALRAAGIPLAAGRIWSDELPKNDTPGAKGDTMHGLVNLVGILGESIWDTACWSTELSWMTYLDVTQNEAVFKGRKNHIVDATVRRWTRPRAGLRTTCWTRWTRTTSASPSTSRRRGSRSSRAWTCSPRCPGRRASRATPPLLAAARTAPGRLAWAWRWTSTRSTASTLSTWASTARTRAAAMLRATRLPSWPARACPRAALPCSTAPTPYSATATTSPSRSRRPSDEEPHNDSQDTDCGDSRGCQRQRAGGGFA